MSIILSINHQQSSHCETGVVATLLQSKGIAMTEPMAFGLASALTFAYLPFVKISGMPLIAYRMPPKTIIKKVCKKLNINLETRKFSNPDAGMQALDDELSKGNLVGLQSSVYWLPYFPEDMRFHFNAHNLVVYGKNDNDEYLISDPVFEHPVTCRAQDLKNARFAKGALAAKGLMYVIRDVPENVNIAPIIKPAIKKTAKMMNGLILPYFGLKGIKHMANKIRALEGKPAKYTRLYLAHIVRMQEEIGTGGAGFRFMYASFLEQASKQTNTPLLLECAQHTTVVGDLWREFAMQAVKYCKKRSDVSLNDIALTLEHVAEQEAKLSQLLIKATK
ncbi:BtrH N-terminal domain-containing protein [Pseudoalteromonas sp. MMG010]|uniref:BtrH N-terminal domain-containing protein n=1 Tax=Pseudoalteromonas sp. MMG010 TaxID=2822685 RepID=UPI001B3A51EC|nr:BtrH N-terminal domain-containing protein [Pseudoalteromonas sp. MMG010]MBQ4833496.1 BtrH N-terminal domain-containing protein [Pseudoalteromonas sp. MMG010]